MPDQTQQNTLKRKKTPPKEDERDAKTKDTRKALHTCMYCGRDISKLYRIKCAMCSSFSLCLACFSVGAELHPHKNNHPYHIHGNLGFPLYDLNWTADEEMLLLEAIDVSGLGNWSAVAVHVGSKTADECKGHFYEIYVRSANFPLPHVKQEMQGVNPLQVLQDRQLKVEAKEASDREDAMAKQVDQGALRPAGAEDIAQVDQGSIEAQGLQGTLSEVQPPTAPEGSGPGTESKTSGSAKKVRTEKAPNEASSQGPAQKQLSIRGLPMPQRPQGSSGPALGTPLPGPSGPSPLVSEGPKLGYDASGYHTKRQEFDHEYDNDAEMLISEISFNSTDTMEETKEKLRLIEVYNDRLSEREHRRDVVLGRDLFHQKKYQGLEKKPSSAADRFSTQMRVFNRYLPQHKHDALVEGMYLEEKMRQRLKELNQLRRDGVRNFDEADVYEGEKRKKAAEGQKYLTGHQKSGVKAGDESLFMTQGLLDTGGKAYQANRPTSSGTQISRNAGNAAFVGNAAAQLAAWRTRRGIQLDVTALPGSQLLTEKERALCVSERLTPSQYLAYKASFLRETERNDKFRRLDARYMFRLRASTSLKVYDLLVSCGWISSGEAEQQPEEAVAQSHEPTISQSEHSGVAKT